MADAKISQLTALTTAADDDLLAIVDTSATETKKIAKSDLVAGLQAELVSGTNIKTINSTSLLGSGDIAISANPAGTAGQIQFSNGSAFAADSNLYWDNTNKRLGVGTSSPTEKTHIYNTAVSDLYLKIQTTQSRTSGIISQNSTANWFNGTQYSAANAYQIFDQTNNRLQLTLFNDGNSQFATTNISLGAKFGIKGSGSTSASTALLVQNSSGTDLLKVTDDGKVNNRQLHIISSSSSLIIANQDTLDRGNGIRYGYSGGSQIHRFYTNSGTERLTILDNGQVSVGNNSPNATAILQADSTTQGFLPPRMTTTQKNAISTPALGLQVVDTTTSRPCVYTTAWESLTSSDSASPTAVYKFWSGTAAQYAALTPDANTVYFVS